MLAYILAVLVGAGSVGLYIAAFFFPEIHRKQDFIWSGVGCFYALTLWIYAREVSGGILVGQTASVTLIGWFAWQIIKLRRQLVPVVGAASQPEPRQPATATTTQLQSQPGSKRSSRTSTSIGTNNVAPHESNPARVASTIKAAPKANPTTPAPTAVHTSQIPTAIDGESSRKNRARSIEVNSPVAPPDRSKLDPNSSIEDERAWIKLETKPSSATTSKTSSSSAKPPPPPPPPAISKPAEEKAKLPSSTQPPVTPPAPPIEKPQPLLERKAETTHQHNSIDIIPIESRLDNEQNWDS
jgi:hypothetical protein